MFIPCGKDVNVTGDVTGWKVLPSRLSSKIRLAGGVRLSEPVNVNVAAMLVGVAGPEVMVAVGGVVSTFQVKLAGAEMLPAWSTASTWMVGVP